MAKRSPAAGALLLLLPLLCVALVTPAHSAPTPAPSSNITTAQVSQFTASHTGSAAGIVWVGNGTGVERRLGGFDAYVAVPRSGGPPASGVLVISDIYGWKTGNVRTWADALAARGFVAVVPDYFRGTARTPADPRSGFAAWLAGFPRARVVNESRVVIEAMRRTWPSLRSIGAQGFCWGGLYAVLLASGSPPAVNASVVYHGSLLTAADVAAVSAPIMFQQADPALDGQINATLYKEIQRVLAAKTAAGLPTSIKAYPGMKHGFAMRGGSEAAVTAAANTAFTEGAAFLSKHLLMQGHGSAAATAAAKAPAPSAPLAG
jgi:dienelactone hydrolase